MSYNPTKSLMYPKRGKRKDASFGNALFIDPGLGGTGWALFNLIDCKAKGFPLPPLYSGAFTPKKSSDSWQQASESVWTWFEALLNSYEVKTIVIEFPEAWLESKKGHASIQRGDILKLAYLIGGLADVMRRKEMKLPILISPREWKGQLPKDVVAKRIRKVFPLWSSANKKITSHEMDAIGMGVAAQGSL